MIKEEYLKQVEEKFQEIIGLSIIATISVDELDYMFKDMLEDAKENL